MINQTRKSTLQSDVYQSVHVGMQVLAFGLLLSMAAPATAQIYKVVDANGNVSYSDQPSQGATRIQVAPLPSIPPAGASASALTGAMAGTSATGASGAALASTAANAVTQYQVVVSTSASDGFIRKGEALAVRASTVPALAAGDRLVYLLNGQPVGEGATASVPTEFLDRGSYSVMAQVVDAAGQTKGNASASFTVQQGSRLINPAQRQAGISNGGLMRSLGLRK